MNFDWILNWKKKSKEPFVDNNIVSMLNFVSVIMVLCLIFVLRRYMLFIGEKVVCTYILLKFTQNVYCT